MNGYNNYVYGCVYTLGNIDSIFDHAGVKNGLYALAQEISEKNPSHPLSERIMVESDYVAWTGTLSKDEIAHLESCHKDFVANSKRRGFVTFSKPYTGLDYKGKVSTVGNKKALEIFAQYVYDNLDYIVRREVELPKWCEDYADKMDICSVALTNLNGYIIGCRKRLGVE